MPTSEAPKGLPRQVTTRISDFFAHLVSVHAARREPHGMHFLVEISVLAGTPLRSLRQAAAAAGFGAWGSLLAEIQATARALEDLRQQQRALKPGRKGGFKGLGHGNGSENGRERGWKRGAEGAARLARLCRANEELQGLKQELHMQAVRVFLMSKCFIDLQREPKKSQKVG